MKGGPIGLLIKAGSKDYNQLAKWFQEIEDHDGEYSVYRQDLLLPPVMLTGDAGENDTYRPLASYSFIDCVTDQWSERDPTEAQRSLQPVGLRSAPIRIKRQSGGNSDDGLEEYPGLSGGGGGGGGGGVDTPSGFPRLI